jgi:DNA-binding PucR family transcriptional regulator
VELGRRKGLTGEIRPGAFLTELLLSRSPRLARLARERVLGPLESYRDSRSANLVATLTMFVECDLDRRRTAARLHVHPNTLDYRLRRIADLAGVDLGRPEDITAVTLALKQRELEGHLAHSDAA